MIDIIIPCHNSHETIDRCIGSILCQRVLASCKVTLVRDGGKDYKDVIDRYSPIMNIQEIGYDDNGGPGKARNYGLTHTSEELVCFIDSDDAFGSPFAIADLCREIMEDPSIKICIGDFMEELAPFVFKKHTDDVTFVHGKMYRRSYLEDNHILFNEKESANEDVGFNILALILLRPEEKVKYYHKITHYWLTNPNSIVRKNKEVFDHSESFRTFVKNMMYMYSEIEKRGLQDTKQILAERVASMGRIMNLYHEKTEGYPQYEEENLKVVKEFYNKIYKPYEHLITKDMLDYAYDNYPYKEVCQLDRAKQDAFLKSLGE